MRKLRGGVHSEKLKTEYIALKNSDHMTLNRRTTGLFLCKHSTVFSCSKSDVIS